MGIRYNSPWLLGAGLALTAAFSAVIGWGRFRAVEVPQFSEWAHVAPLCADAGVQLAEAVAVLDAHDLPVRAELGPCDDRAAIHLHVSPADVDRIRPSEGTIGAAEIRGVFERRIVSGVIVDCQVYLQRGTDTGALVHEVLHCLGYDHAIQAPAGHVMNRDYARIGLTDFRGVP